MKLFECSNCNYPVFFENTTCENCKFPLGYWPQENRMLALKPTGSELWESVNPDKVYFRFCSNYQYKSCNWLLAADQEEFCTACELNETIPNLDKPGNLQKWRKIEYAKHRLVYSLLKLNLPLISKDKDPEMGLEFNFLSDDYNKDEPVLTGHAQGVITLNIKEADPVYRERSRKMFRERYRTLIGHFRHEIGHYYWDLLIGPNPEEFRELFGDETLDYGEALDNYYAEGPPKDWKDNYISAYATMHPWEDWAECWAHYMHLVDTLETGYSYGIQIHPRIKQNSHISLETCTNPYDDPDFDKIISQSMPLVFAVNSINRSMGQPDLYPFVVTPGVQEKLRFIHNVIHKRNNDGIKLL